MHDFPGAPAPLDVRDLLALFLLDPDRARAQLARLTAPQRAMQALCVAALLGMDDAALLAVWDARNAVTGD